MIKITATDDNRMVHKTATKHGYSKVIGTDIIAFDSCIVYIIIEETED